MAQKKDDLGEYFSFERPLGRGVAIGKPSASGQILFSNYYDQGNKVFRAMRQNKTMIVGRRGSGKTDALLSHVFLQEQLGKYDPIVFFEAGDTAALFHNVLYLINRAIRQDEPKPMVENIARLWEHIFWVLAIKRLCQNSKLSEGGRARLSNFIDGYHFDDGVDDPYVEAQAVVRTLVEQYEIQSGSSFLPGFFNSINQISISEISFDQAKVDSSNHFLDQKTSALILIDSFEKLDISREEDNLALSGLLMAVGQMHDGGVPMEIRCCIPSEIYHRVTDLSSNLLKDFERQLTLHWSHMELLTLCKRRFAKFLEYHFPEKHAALRSVIRSEEREDTIAFWLEFLPPEIPNLKDGLMEETIPYILRHTQLLPRHLILVLNDIFEAHLSEVGTIDVKVSSKLIKEKVRAAEGKIARQIVSAYEYVWPKAKEQLELLLKHIGHNVFTIGDLQRLVNTFPVRNYGNIYNYADYLLMATELGVVGRLIKRTNRYIVAVYEYGEPFRLILNDSDELCVHPCFTESFGVLSEANLPEDYVPIYPLGTILDDPDRRGEL